ncbi:hypothetical protein ACFYXC_41165 [Streptomyces sp. NPDC002701]|uniref:hypothetical protein n=1 Tax=Streptomyces sp. NPDC002701 TaxID=3364661 RepID=UPI0036CED1F4
MRAKDARIQAEQQTLERTRTRAESWALIVAALVGAASLSVTAWGTYWTAQVAEDQLTQSKEHNEDKARAQASKVTFWLERPKGESRDELVIVNRSLDPVNQLVLDIRSGSTAIINLNVLNAFSVFPPCSEIRLATADLVPNFDEPQHLRVTVQFIDSAGMQWERDSLGVLQAGHYLHSLPENGPLENTPVRPLKECGSDQ